MSDPSPWRSHDWRSVSSFPGINRAGRPGLLLQPRGTAAGSPPWHSTFTFYPNWCPYTLDTQSPWNSADCRLPVCWTTHIALLMLLSILSWKYFLQSWNMKLTFFSLIWFLSMIVLWWLQQNHTTISYIHSLYFIKRLLCARHFSRCWRYNR